MQIQRKIQRLSIDKKGINVPVTVINLFSGDDGANNNVDKCDMGNVHARNLSERIGK